MHLVGQKRQSCLLPIRVPRLLAIVNFMRRLIFVVALLALAPTAASASPQGADFNNDGFGDLAIGSGESVGDPPSNNAGAVSVLYGSSGGISTEGDERFSQQTPGIDSAPGNDERFGEELAWGDFDGDGFDDLAIGASYENVFNGAVHVLYGRASGLSPKNDDFWFMSKPGVPGTGVGNAYFGLAIAAGDFDGDGHDDLAIGAKADKVKDVSGAGAVVVLYGSDSGVTTNGAQRWSQAGLKNSPEQSDNFGSSLATGEFGKGKRDDLAIGAPMEDVPGAEDSGLVHVVYGTRSGLRKAGNVVLQQGINGVSDSREPQDQFGNELAAGDIARSERSDLVVAAQNEALSGSDYAGAIHALYGTRNGLKGEASEMWDVQTAGLGAIQPSTYFGYSVAVGNVGAGSNGDVLVGSLMKVGSALQAGAVGALYGTDTGLSGTGNKLLTQDVDNVDDVAEGPDWFGASVAVANFGSGPQADVAIGVPQESFAGTPALFSAGGVNVLYGSPTGVDTVGPNFLYHEDFPGVLGTGEAYEYFGKALGD